MSQQSQATSTENKKTYSVPSWVSKLAQRGLDALSATIILALAVYGAQHLVSTNFNDTVKMGISLMVVGLLASRLLERRSNKVV